MSFSGMRASGTVSRWHAASRLAVLPLRYFGLRLFRQQRSQQKETQCGAHHVSRPLDHELLRLERLSRELDERLPAAPYDARLHTTQLERAWHRKEVATGGDGLLDDIAQFLVAQVPTDDHSLDATLVHENR